MLKKQWLDRGPCPKCKSSDANVKHKQGYSYCFSCDTRFGDNVTVVPKQEWTVKPMSTTGSWGNISDRKISMDTAKKYSTKIKQSGNIVTHHLYGYFNDSGEQIGHKVRQCKDKRMWVEGELTDALLFGQNIFSPKGKYITICEGEVDAMSAYELMGSKWPSVSIKPGAGSALRDCKNSFTYLDSFDNVIICFDMDKQGQEAAQEVAQLFAPNKARIVRMDHKDANEYLKMGQRAAFNDCWWNAKPFTPAGIINLKDLGETLYEEDFCETCLYPWPKMNEKTYGMRTGELITFCSGSGMGKSSIIRELMHHFLRNTKDNIGILALEESVKNTAWNIMSVEADARLYIKEIRDQFTPEQLQKFQAETINSGRFFAFDHFGSVDNDEILARVRFMAQALDCKWIFLDHLSILVSGQEDMGDERRGIDLLMTKLRSLVEETQVGLLLVSHLRRTTGDRGHEDGREVSLSHLRGSQSIAHLSDSVIGWKIEDGAYVFYPEEGNSNNVPVLILSIV